MIRFKDRAQIFAENEKKTNKEARSSRANLQYANVLVACLTTTIQIDCWSSIWCPEVRLGTINFA